MRRMTLRFSALRWWFSLQEIEQADPVLKTYIAKQIILLLEHRDFEYAVQSTARNNPEREAIIFRRLDGLSCLDHQIK